MKKLSLLLFVVILSAAPAFSQRRIPVFVSGTEGYGSYRIPAVIRLPDGALLAFAEGRVNGASDFGHVNIVMKKSEDEGATWSALTVVAENGALQAGNPAPVVDLTDPAYPGGRIFLFYNTGDQPESHIRKGDGTREVWYKTSTDNGATWSGPVNITAAVKRPGWRSYANTPGHAIQLTEGPFKGRIYVAANHSAGGPQPHFADYRAHGFYTDDHGKTFHVSGDVNIPGGNESMAVELNSHRLMMNIRDQEGEPRCRIIAVSSDGGVHWDTACYDRQLPDPVCQGSILNVGRAGRTAILAFCNNADTVRRDHLTLRISENGGKTWKRKYEIDKSKTGDRGDFTGYSDLVKTGKHTIGVLYEKAGYSQIVFTLIKWHL